ncbi:coiled-coil domain-containing protein 178-like isoform X2 [Mytilus californianus]|uniref:coiled-coil domain-containing protein 178-like isoform X2 n=1 Tax=Mytilus californianus TaxID=6549 RepID=UPI0022480A15|nr:coiled-coil domain-containing protein 178-like isoform X2 [Mytilus californianus]
MSQTKVVKVEEVEIRPDSYSLGERFSSQEKFNNAVQEIEATFIGSSGDGLNEEELSETADKVYPLPENWPKIPQIFRRKSCELTKATSPCVKKAVSHLELIQNIIEEWFRERDEEQKSRPSSVRPVASKKQLRFSGASGNHNVIKSIGSAKGRQSAASGRTTISLSSANQLSITGIGAIKEEDGALLPYLGAEDVLDEVVTLLARLENDRVEILKSLENEKEKVVRLNDKIDHLCLVRMRELPIAVQREHEACIMDLNELTWHVSYSSRTEKRIHQRTHTAEVNNQRLNEEISFVQRHIPLVKEKLQLEIQAMESIKNAQSKTYVELDNTQKRRHKTEAKSNDAVEKATTERNHIKRELDVVKESLDKISDDYAQSRLTYDTYIKQINDIKAKLIANDMEIKVLHVKNENAKVAEEMKAKQVRELQTQITEAEFEHDRLDNENLQLQSELDTRKHKMNKRISELERGANVRDARLRNITLKNKEAEMEVQDYMDKISDCQRQKVADEKNISRIHKEQARLQQQMAVTEDEYKKISIINSAVRDQLLGEQEKAFKMEESLKATAETLRRQVKDELHTKSVLVARINSDSTDLVKYKKDTTQKRDKAQKVANEVQTAVHTVLTKVEKLRSTKKEKTEAKDKIRQQMEETEKQKEESRNKFMEQINNLEPHHTHLKDDVTKLEKRLDYMEWKTEQMNKQIHDMDREEVTFKKLVDNAQKAIVDLEERRQELDLQMEALKKIEDDLKKSYEEVLGRIRDNEASHRKLIEERKKFLGDSEVQKSHKLEINKELASKYRRLQNEHMIVKDKMMNNFDDRVKIEVQIKDTTQLQALQRRMHVAMLAYLKYRGLYNRSELDRMETETDQNSEQVQHLQVKMDEAIKQITEFLQTQVQGGAAAKRVAWGSVGKTSRGVGLSQPPSRQPTVVEA